MMRKLATAMLMVSAGLVSNFAMALGLGELKLNSALNEKFDAEIKLLNVGELSKNEILPNLASHQDFARAGVERVFFLTNLKFDVRLENGDAYIRLTSDKIVREPFLNFLVELHWPSGRILREYTVLIDPPIFSETPAVSVNKAATTPPDSGKQTSERTERREVTQQVPSTDRTFDSGQAKSEGVTVAVKKNDTLWGIARDNRPSREVSISQTMLAIQKDNPHAFIRNNINLLKAGQVLKIPSADKIRSFSTAEAFVETQRQEDEWRNSRPIDARQEDEMLSEQIEEEPETSDLSDQETADVESAGQLKLLTDDVQEASLDTEDEVAASGASIDALQDESYSDDEDNASSVINQDLAAEAGERGGETNADVSANVKALEEQVESLKKLLNLKDQQLAMLQAGAENNADVSVTQEEGQQALGSIAESTDGAVQPAALKETPEKSAASKPVKVTEEKSWLDTLTGSPMYIGLAILAVLVGLVILGALSRRKNAESDYPDDLKTVLNKAESDVQLPKDLEEELDQELAIAEAAAKSDDSEQAEADDMDDFELPELDTDIDKLSEEADIYIAYGRHERALEMLEPVVMRHPESIQLRLKLAEVYAATGNLEGLAEQKAAIESEGDEQALATLEGFKVKMSEPASAEPVEEFPQSAQEASNPLEDVDQNLPSLNDFDDELADSPDEFTPGDDDELEFTLDEMELDQSAQEQAEALADSDGSDQEEDSDDLDFLGDADEATTKLDLARAYIEMADKDAAQDILNEVLEEGSDEQQDEARKLLESIA